MASYIFKHLYRQFAGGHPWIIISLRPLRLSSSVSDWY